MKQQMQKSQRLPRCRNRLKSVPIAMLFCALSAQAQTDAILPPIGGGGGGQFMARCQDSELLTGVEIRTGDDVDSIRPICIPAQAEQFRAYPYRFGGQGGGAPMQLVCRNNAPVVTGMHVSAEGEKTIVVNNIHLFCDVAATTQTPSEFPSAVFDGPRYNPSGLRKAPREATQRCPTGLVAVGIHGRSGIWLDALGLVCGPPALTPASEPPVVTATSPPKPVIKIRIPTSDRIDADSHRRITDVLTPAATHTSATTKVLRDVIISRESPLKPDPPICASARKARARNSPATPGLEAQCRAAGGIL